MASSQRARNTASPSLNGSKTRVKPTPAPTLVLGFPDYRLPAQRLATAAGLDYAEVEVHRFPDGESRIRLPSGRMARVSYADDQTPWVSSRLQDFFGMKETPRIAGGEVRLVVHLLAPSQRPVQVTSDLEGFWERHYPQIRRELMRRYPKHKWPENPYTQSQV